MSRRFYDDFYPPKEKIVFQGKGNERKIFSEKSVYLGIDSSNLMHKIQLEDGTIVNLNAMEYTLLTDISDKHTQWLKELGVKRKGY